MRARIDISEVEAQTKIRAKYLRAIENEEWDLLPGSVYVKSFVRTYGDFLGLDSRLLIDEFKRRYERPDDHEIRPISTLNRDRDRDRRPRDRDRRPRERDRRPRERTRRPRRLLGGPSSAVMVICAALVVIIAGLAVIGTSAPSSNGAKGPKGKTGSTHGHQHPKTGSGGHPSSTTGGHPSSTTGGTTTRTPPKPRDATLALVPTGGVWVCVEGPGKKLLIPGSDFVAGQKIPTESARALWVNLGTDHVQATVDGKAYSLPQSGGGIGLKITPTGAKLIAKPPTCL